jgi:hypothetical protein
MSVTVPPGRSPVFLRTAGVCHPPMRRGRRPSAERGGADPDARAGPANGQSPAKTRSWMAR